MQDTPDTAEKQPARRLRLSPVWLIPLGALLIGAWLVYQNVSSRGPTIILELDNAEGLEAGKTQVKLLNVDVGTVRDVRLADDFDGALAEISMKPKVAQLLVADSEFWVVKPRVGRQGISGLGTIISGAYIQMRPGDSDQRQWRFEVLAQPPPTRPDVPGVTIELASKGDDSLSIGDPVVYKGQSVGQIETSEFNADTQQVRYRIFVESPYDELITDNTQFWLRSGIDVALTSEGVEVQVGNLQAILAGGVTFGVPEDLPAGAPVDDGTRFTLHSSYREAREQRYDEHLSYVALFKDSIRGLNPGASVEYRGVRVGTVVEVPFFDERINVRGMEDFRIPVLIHYEPQRLGGSWKGLSLEQWRERLNELFEKGLRATIKSANLLTGAMFVELAFDPDARLSGPRRVGPYAVFPSAPGGFATLQEKLTQLLDKVNGLPIESLMAELESGLRGTNATLDRAQQTLDNLNAILRDDALRQLPAELKSTLREVRDTLDSFQGGNPAYDNLNRSLNKLNRVLDNLAPLTDTLRDDPNALIFGHPSPADPVPRAHPDAAEPTANE